MSTITDIQFTEIPGKNGDIGIITLQRPHALNALSHTMLLAITKQLREWQVAPSIKAVVVRAEGGRAFCAGGDIREIYNIGLTQHTAAYRFFADEYRLNHTIFHFPKPYIAFLDGITMGGGAGISLHGSHRVATERLTFAMPETGIGFFPDVGATYFLPRLPHHCGFYLGLTGQRIDYRDCLGLQLATHYIKSDRLEATIAALANTAFSSDAKQSVSAILQAVSLTPEKSPLLIEQEKIAAAFAKQTITEIQTTLLAANDAWSKETAVQLQTKSPTSLQVTLRALQLGLTLDFDNCMQMEFRLARRFLQRRDFYEGVRAVIIDKDKHPHWQPVDNIDPYFAPLTPELFN